MFNANFQDFVLNNFPYPISINYLRIIEAKSWQDKVEQSIRVFEFLMRSVTLALVCQYLIEDGDKLSEKKLNRLLRERLSKPSLGSWVEMFFALLDAYKSRPDLLLMPELYSFYWDEQQNRPHKGIHESFDIMVTIRNDLAHGLPPREEILWQNLFERADKALGKILQFFKFLENYDLIYIVRQKPNRYWYLRYRGQEVKEVEEPLKTDKNLKEGWFYFYRRNTKRNQLLRLYPFIVSWRRDSDINTPGLRNDAALFDKYSVSRIYYLATVLWEKFTVDDEPHLAEFFYNFERTLNLKIDSSKHLSWIELKNITNQISLRRMGDVIKKYEPELYLQRQDVLTVYQDFLDSEKICLVITGKSGVGKTNFLISLSERITNSDKVCCLFYNGASLPVDLPFEEILQSDFKQLDNLDPLENMRFWTELSKFYQRTNGKLIVFIDAINENPEAAKLLHRLNYFIETLSYPWIKVVITSRPEAWRVIAHNIKLSTQHYYRKAGSDYAGVELKEFSEDDSSLKTLTIDKFSKNELQTVYEKYKKKYSLQSAYNDISVEVRQVLRDPLILRLLAEIFRDKNIPSKFPASNIFAAYVNTLQASNRLSLKDLHLLRKEIIPLMAMKLDNSLSEDDIYPNKILYEQIFISEKLSDGQAINQSYTNLVDSEILALLPLLGYSLVAFKFERFYEFFLGEHFYQTMLQEKDISGAYLKLIRLSQSKPFLWGAVKNSLIAEMKTENDDLIFHLASYPDQIVREILAAAVSEFGQEEGRGAVAHRIVLGLMKLDRPHLLLLKTIRVQILGRVKEAAPRYSATIIAQEISLHLEFEDILLEAAKNRIQFIRVLALRNIYHLWRKNPVKALGVFEDLAGQAINNYGIPNFTILESCLSLSLLLLRDYRPDQKTGRKLGQKLVSIWQSIIRRIFFVSERELLGKRLLRSMLRNLVISFIVRFLVALVEGLPGAKDNILGDAGVIFHASPKIKERYNRFIQFLRNPGDILTIRDDLVAAVSENDAITSIIVMLIFIIQDKDQRDETILLLSQIANESLKQNQPGWYDPAMVRAIGYIGVIQEYPPDQIFSLSEKVIKNRLDATRGIYYSVRNHKHWNTDLSLHNLMRYSRQNPIDKDLYYHFLIIANQNLDLEYLDILISDLTYHAITFHNPEGALEALKAIFPVTDERIVQMIVRCLIKIRDHYPENVKEFILEVDEDRQLLSNEVLRSESNERPWVDLLQISSAEILVRLIRTEEIKGEIVEILAEAVHQTKWSRYFDVAVKRIINAIAGLQLFNIKEH